MSDSTKPRGVSSPAGKSVRDYLSAPQSADELGRLGDYRILKLLGQGGMGVVFVAEDVRLQREVALKVMSPELAADPRGSVRFLREARAAASVKHDNVVTIYDVGEANGLPYLAMERLKGVTLEEWITQKGPPPVSHVVRIAREIAAALGAAHDRGLVHRDIKPSNVFLEKPTGRVKVLDFGLAVQPEGNTRVTSTGVIVGTPEYMSPEQARGEPVDHRSDLFSLGVVMYRMAVGKPPFSGPTPLAVMLALSVDTPPPVRTINPQVPVGLDHLIQRLMSKYAKDRPAGAAEVIQLLTGPLTTPSLADLKMPSHFDMPAMPPSPIPAAPVWPTAAPVGPQPGTYTAATIPPAAPAAPTAPFTPSPTEAFRGLDDEEDDRPKRRKRRREEDEEDDDRRSRRRRRDDEDDDDRGSVRVRQSTSVNVNVVGGGGGGGGGLGGVSLGMGITAIVFFPLGCITCGITTWIAPFLAIAGLITGIFATGGLRIAGLILNSIALIPSVMIMTMGFGGVLTLLGLGKWIPDRLVPKVEPEPPPIIGKPNPNPKPNPTPEAEDGELAIQFTKQTNWEGLAAELFIDGKRQDGFSPRYDPDYLHVVRLPAGDHNIAVKFRGKEVHSGAATVKALATGGRSPYAVPHLEDPDAPGALKVEFTGGGTWWKTNLELFIDGKLSGFLLREASFPLPPGPHKVEAKKNGVTIFSQDVTVKKLADGTTFQTIFLDFVVNVTLTANSPVGPGVEAYVYVDGNRVRRWDAGLKQVTVEVEVGNRVIEVRAEKPLKFVVAKFDQAIEPKKPITLTVKN